MQDDSSNNPTGSPGDDEETRKKSEDSNTVSQTGPRFGEAPSYGIPSAPGSDNIHDPVNQEFQRSVELKTQTGMLKQSRVKWFLENLISLFIALFLILMIRSSVIEAFKIPSGSMIPTLLVGDHIFVNKFAYGLKVPFTEWFRDPIYLFKSDPPKRGDIIVFKFPPNQEVYYIKRVIGLPGDKVEMKGKRLFINDKPLETKQLTSGEAREINKVIDTKEYPIDMLDFYEEDMGERHPITMTDQRSAKDKFGPTTIPEDHFFVMGDNRDHSYDSRFWGFVPMKFIKGRAIVIWLSLWLDIQKNEYDFRPERTGMTLK